MKEKKIATIRGKAAKKIAEVLDMIESGTGCGVIIYRLRKESGRNVLDVYTEDIK